MFRTVSIREHRSKGFRVDMVFFRVGLSLAMEVQEART